MKYIHVSTSFLTCCNKYLILKRSNCVNTMKSLWGAISGTIEKNERAADRAYIEILEEAGIQKNQLKLIKTGKNIHVLSKLYDRNWYITPFLFETLNFNIALNWEHSLYVWILPYDLQKFHTVPKLKTLLFDLLS